MQNFVKEVQVRWSDLDPNVHLRHTVYYDWGALSRIEFLYAQGLTAKVMEEFHFGPILFREECVFRKEIRFGDRVTISLNLISARRDYSRWSIQHHIMKNDDTLSAVLTVDGAWLDLVQRKLAAPPGKVGEVFSKMPVGEGFKWQD
ncbi:MAG: thioesterase family protein [Chitinophagaceae bacterium]|nr:thioesterase family protein [Chitinophagaceae bacterium]